MTETKCEGRTERSGFMAEDVRLLIHHVEQTRRNLIDYAHWEIPDDPKEVSSQIRE
ncbi:unnamed protein product, partial [marine sediment metagenome]